MPSSLNTYRHRIFAGSGKKQARTTSCYLATVLNLDLVALACHSSMHAPDMFVLVLLRLNCS